MKTRRLATANRSRVSIRGRPCEIFPTCSLIATQNLIIVSHTACTHVGCQKNVDSGAPPLGTGTWLTQQKHATPPDVSSHQILSLLVKPFGRRQGSQQFFFRTLWPSQLRWASVADPQKHANSCVSYPAKFRRSRSNHASVIKISQKNLTLPPFNAAEIDTNRSATYYFLLAIHSTVSKINGNFGRKSQIPHPGIFNAPTCHWNFVTVVALKMVYTLPKNCDDRSVRLDPTSVDSKTISYCACIAC